MGLYAKDKANYKEANRLIKNKKQDIAIEKILEILESHPESLNTASGLLKKAMKNQDKFVSQFLSIIAQLYENPDDNMRILKIIANIERLNTAMEPEMVEFLQKLKVSSLYATNRIKFNKIMKEGVDFIKRQLYLEALAKFMEGYSICYADYVEIYENTERLTKTEDAVKSIKSSYNDFRKEDVKFLNAINAYKLMLRQNILTPDSKVIETFEEEIKQMHSIGQTVFMNSRVLSSFLSEDEKKVNFTEDSFLPYATRITAGRANATEYEGVSGALEVAIFFRLKSIQDYIISLIQRTYSNGFAKFNFKAPSDPTLNASIAGYIREYKRITDLVESINKTNTRFPYNQTESKNNLANLLTLNEIIVGSLAIYDRYLAIWKGRR